jgi:glutathione S-transferase
MPRLHRLVTISFSHYCEKARWALDLTRTPYEEEPYVPMVHLVGTLPRGGRSTPLLVAPDGRRLVDSTDILRYLDDRNPGALYPREHRDEIEALEDLLDEQVGPHTRRLAYHALLADGGAVTPLIRSSSRGWQRIAAPVLGRVLPPALRRALRITDEGAARSRAKLDAALDTLDARLSDERRYLVGDQATAADLTLAALLAPVLRPPEQPVTGRVEPTGSTPTLDALVETYRTRPSGQLALRLYREERPPSMGRR